MRTFTAYVEWDAESRLSVGSVPGIVGAHSQAASLDELNDNLREVLQLCLEEQPELASEAHEFVGIQQIRVPA